MQRPRHVCRHPWLCPRLLVPKLGADALLPHARLDPRLALFDDVGLLLALPPRRLVLALRQEEVAEGDSSSGTNRSSGGV